MTQENTQDLEQLAEDWILELYGIKSKATVLYSYEDVNFLVSDQKGQKYIFKLSSDSSSIELLSAQNQLLSYLQENSINRHIFPLLVSGVRGEMLYQRTVGRRTYCLRLLTYLHGELMHKVAPSEAHLSDLGRLLGELNQCLLPLDLPVLRLRTSAWDLQHAALCLDYMPEIVDPHYRRLVGYFMQQYQHKVLPAYRSLPMGIIHGDANDHNILIDGERVSGLIDFGDTCYSYLIHELAIAITYMMMDTTDPIQAAGKVAEGYHQQRPLIPKEFEVLYYLVAARLCTSLCFSSHRQTEDPSNKYLTVHQDKVKRLLDWLISTNPVGFREKIKKSCGLKSIQKPSARQLVAERSQYLSSALSLSYKEPIVMVGGAMQYLYDEQEIAYLDCVNNISHVGHCHPVVVTAASNQMAILNTNTRYLYQQLTDYGKAICDLLPDPLSVAFFVNSGTEANELALRLARLHTGKQDMLVLEGAYHGNSASTVDISPYKYQGKGGKGRMPFIHEIPVPDLYAGKFRADNGYNLSDYLGFQQEIITNMANNREGFAGFIAESLLGCGGQIVLPDGYLKATYHKVRGYGGVCIADEVQVGFGRVGSHFWGFETQGVIPDIVTMGKPMGNGHPLAAVVTTREIAHSFENGMEYFNSFGGNPVSCEIGKAVLEVIQQEKLQQHAQQVGNLLKRGLSGLKDKHRVIGEVRGLGLFLGVELVVDPETREPAAKLAANVVEAMKDRGILLSTDGPRHNVIKIKPPMVFTEANADRLVRELDQVLEQRLDW